MAMFDWFHINTEVLPMDIFDKRKLGSQPGWQTKSLDRHLDHIRIMHDGFLERRKFLRKNFIPIKFSGNINFYTYTDDKFWYEFDAFFEDGKLVSVTKNPRCANYITCDPLPPNLKDQ